MLCDRRYSRPATLSKLPTWIKDRTTTHTTFGPAFAALRKVRNIIVKNVPFMIDILNFHILSVCSSFLVLPGKEAETSIVPLPKDPTNISLIFMETCDKRMMCNCKRGGKKETQSSISHHRLLNILHPCECCWLKKNQSGSFSVFIFIIYFIFCTLSTSRFI